MKRSKLLLISALMSTLYIGYSLFHFVGGVATSSGAEALGAGIATAIVMPHLICACIALIFNWIGWVGSIRWCALVSGIMYAVSMVAFFLYAFFVVIQMIFCFIAFAKLKSLENT